MREMLSFDKMVARDIISWNAMIVGYGNHGLRMEACTEAILQFHHMQASGIKPDDVTFIGLLSACSHSGLVIEGKHWLSAMSQEFNITPWMEHYICVVDLSPGLDFWMGHKVSSKQCRFRMMIMCAAHCLHDACRVHIIIWNSGKSIQENSRERIYRYWKFGPLTYTLLLGGGMMQPMSESSRRTKALRRVQDAIGLRSMVLSMDF
ncbi:hypothetical protein C1H46_020187 [Malus baccata]|uniref:DYW domain-containing protein n=1 Tax=Malus baccata TaxID=106549 RepID=A0A540M6A8_MALBA|nr:hypothetical protein C1H46_020187 [Malus baccata]